MNYQDYLQSAHWKDVKQRYYRSKFKKECFICGKKNLPLHLHHRTYKRLGKEKLNDLILLCENCHHLLHKMFNNKKSRKTTLWNVSNKLRKNIRNRRHFLI